MFTQDSILLAGEPVQPTWVVDSGATNHITAFRELLRGTRKLEEPKVFGLADRTMSMKASEVGEVHVRLRSGRKITSRDAYYVPASRVSLLSLSSLLKHGWTVDMRDGGGTIKRGRERLTLRKDGLWWTTVRNSRATHTRPRNRQPREECPRGRTSATWPHRRREAVGSGERRDYARLLAGWCRACPISEQGRLT
jgi:hypothetical protein